MPLSSVVGASSILRPGVCTSSTRPAAPFEGQTIYETDTDRLLSYDGSAWIPYVKQTAGKVLQVVSTTKTDTFSSSSTSFVDITGLAVTITPSATSSKILLVGSVATGAQAGIALRITGGNAAAYVGDTAGSRIRAFASQWEGTVSSGIAMAITYLDSPSTTSATTYTVQGISMNSANTFYVNRSHNDTDNATYARTASTITAMEISG